MSHRGYRWALIGMRNYIYYINDMKLSRICWQVYHHAIRRELMNITKPYIWKYRIGYLMPSAQDYSNTSEIALLGYVIHVILTCIYIVYKKAYAPIQPIAKSGIRMVSNLSRIALWCWFQIVYNFVQAYVTMFPKQASWLFRKSRPNYINRSRILAEFAEFPYFLLLW